VFTSLLGAAVGAAAAKLERKVGEWAGNPGGAEHDKSEESLPPLAEAGLDAVAEGGGAAQNAAAEGVKAKWQGNNPIWAAVQGAWQSGTPAVRAAIVTAAASAILLLAVSPVLCLVFLLSLLVIAAIHRAGQASSVEPSKR
jgi:hypothetical protein